VYVCVFVVSPYALILCEENAGAFVWREREREREKPIGFLWKATRR
jgi:hypothetical protein